MKLVKVFTDSVSVSHNTHLKAVRPCFVIYCLDVFVEADQTRGEGHCRNLEIKGRVSSDEDGTCDIESLCFKVILIRLK